ncbi:MAG: Ig domain-containing protein, partial [Bacteroidales bacterium]|nr:Ig domain-containing protein [Bacteroidales bacterium]
MKLKYILYLSCLAFLSSCVAEMAIPEEDVIEDGIITLNASLESNPQTRTVRRPDGSVWWNTSEAIRVFFGDTSSKFTSTNTEPAATTTFTGSVGGYRFSGNESLWAVYPYSETDAFDGQTLKITIPNRQNAVAGTFDKNSFPSVAKSRNFELSFKNVCGGVKFCVSSDGIKKVTFNGNHFEPLAGTVNVVIDDAGIPTVASIESSYSELSVSAPEGSTLEKGKWYYLVSLPVKLTSGYTMTIVYEDNHREILKSEQGVEIKRCVFGTLTNIDKKETERQEPAGGTESGLYLGIIGFNTQLYPYPIKLLKYKTKPEFDAFIDGLTQEHATLLYYSVKEAIRTLQVANYPDNLYSASIVTFTDGEDDGSVFHESYPGSNDDYLREVNKRLYEEEVAGLPLSAWTIGLQSKDASTSLFTEHLHMLSKPSSNGVRVSNMSEVNAAFDKIAGELNNSFYIYNISITMVGKPNGTKVRFTLDGVSDAGKSAKYIEGTFNMNDLSLYDISYHGITCRSGAIVKGTRKDNMVTFRFESIRTDDNSSVDKGKFMQWGWNETVGIWQRYSEFDPGQASGVEKVKNSAVVLLNLDCTTSLTSENGDLFPQLKVTAKNFIANLCAAAADPSRVASVSLDKSTLNLVVGNSSTLYATVLPVTAVNKRVSWSTSDVAVATVTGSGRVQAVAPGKAYITVTTEDEQCTAACEVIVSAVHVTSVSLDKTELLLNLGDTYTLKATVAPSNATYKDVTYSSSNNSVATVDSGGKITALAEGTAVITAQSVDNSSRRASCKVTVKDPTKPEAVDLGLPSGLKWANMNVGATSPEGYGSYYAWGETEPKSNYNWSTYKWCNGSEYTQTKYNTSSSFGTVDNKTVLDPEDDAAHVNWGGSWRMPTKEEQDELRTKCTWTWTTQNGVKGRLVTGPNGKSIFLPAAGLRNDTNLIDVGSKGRYWFSSLYTGYPNYADGVYFDSGGVFKICDCRYVGLSVRPVYSAFVPVSSVSLNKTSLELRAKDTYQFAATVSPSNATAPDVHWASSDESVAKVDQNGLVTAVAVGTATIMAYGSSGVSAACIVAVKDFEYVDLGLPSGLKWATMNVGATKPEEYGSYFAWGETQPKTNYSWSTYKFELGTNHNGPFSKYVTNPSYGTVDNKTVLDTEDDAARVNWGGSWRMPTYSEVKELQGNCVWKSTTLNGVDGWLCTSKINGSTLFFPSAGYVKGTSYLYQRSMLFILSSELYNNNSRHGWRWMTNTGVFIDEQWYRYIGHTVRPVYSDFVPVSSISLNKTSLELRAKDTYQFAATVSPSNATARDVRWASSDESVAKVDQNGLVTAIVKGTATITAYGSSGVSAACIVTVKARTNTNGHDYVDLGLPSGRKWSTMNVGATKPEGYGS